MLLCQVDFSLVIKKLPKPRNNCKHVGSVRRGPGCLKIQPSLKKLKSECPTSEYNHLVQLQKSEEPQMYCDILGNIVTCLPPYQASPAPAQKYTDFNAFAEKQAELGRELQLMRATCAAIKGELEDLLKRHQQQDLTQKQKKKSNTHAKKRKIFKKDYGCPLSPCERKFSSKIALRAHIRQKHEQRNMTNEN